MSWPSLSSSDMLRVRSSAYSVCVSGFCPVTVGMQILQTVGGSLLQPVSLAARQDERGAGEPRAYADEDQRERQEQARQPTRTRASTSRWRRRQWRACGARAGDRWPSRARWSRQVLRLDLRHRGSRRGGHPARRQIFDVRSLSSRWSIIRTGWHVLCRQVFDIGAHRSGALAGGGCGCRRGGANPPGAGPREALACRGRSSRGRLLFGGWRGGVSGERSS